jgi:hypothetical protein
MMQADALVLIYRKGQTLSLGSCSQPTGSRFGGLAETPIVGFELEVPLHQIAVLSPELLEGDDSGSLGIPVPLLHGMRYDGSRLRYNYDKVSIRVEQLSPRYASESWPYRCYPAVLPERHLDVQEVVHEPWEAFCQRAYDLPTTQPAEAVVVVPTPRGLGFSMWGGADPALVFEVSLTSRAVYTYNVYD